MAGIIKGHSLMTEPGEMYLGAIELAGQSYAYASDPTLCGVFLAGRWFTRRWDEPAAERFNGDVEQKAADLIHFYKDKVVAPQ